MGFCSNRHFLLTICTLQLVTTIERQVFDFLGFMWVPILVNFFNIIFVILGFFGAFQYRPKYIISYSVWNVLWLGWNIFLTCFYFSAGVLDKNSDLLNLGTGSFSWWQINGPGCKPHYNSTVPDRPDVYRPVRPDRVTGCVLDYEIIEVLHSSTQCLLAVMAVIGGICLSRVFLEEDDSFDFVGGGDFGLAGHTALHPMYVSYSALAPQTKQSQAHGESYYYPSNTGTTTAGSHRSSSVTLAESRVVKCADYSTPYDQLMRRPDYDSLNSRIASNYSPMMRTRGGTRQSRNLYRPRVHGDYVRDQSTRLRSFKSDPRLSAEEQNLNFSFERTREGGRPLSMFVNNY